MSSMEELMGLTKEFSDAFGALSDRVEQLNEELETVKRRYLRGIKSAVAVAAEKKSVLVAAVDQSRDLFVKPKTVVFHGVKIGLQKQPGRMEIADEDQTMKLIRKHYPEQADVLIKKVESVSKESLSLMPAADLKRLGVTLASTTDAVVVNPTNSDVDKVVKALLKDAVDDVEQAKAA